jgi:hypothetical protein
MLAKAAASGTAPTPARRSRRVLAGLAVSQGRRVDGECFSAARGRLGAVPGVLLLKGQGCGVGKAGPSATRPQRRAVRRGPWQH